MARDRSPPTDVDGDGDLDVLSASLVTTRSPGMRTTAGLAIFTFTEIIITTGRRVAVAESVTTADVDGDGDLDVLSASLQSMTTRSPGMRTTAGSIPLHRTIIITTSRRQCSLAVPLPDADVDGDGDLDVLSASSWRRARSRGMRTTADRRELHRTHHHHRRWRYIQSPLRTWTAMATWTCSRPTCNDDDSESPGMRTTVPKLSTPYASSRPVAAGAETRFRGDKWRPGRRWRHGRLNIGNLTTRSRGMRTTAADGLLCPRTLRRLTARRSSPGCLLTSAMSELDALCTRRTMLQLSTAAVRQYCWCDNGGAATKTSLAVGRRQRHHAGDLAAT